MQHFTANTLTGSMAGNPVEYLEFLRVPSMSTGIYHLKAGSSDPQQPHDEDEIYYVLTGKSGFTSSGVTIEISPGSVIFVAAEEVHQFHDIVEDLTLLVFFASNQAN